jgi:hypothetical protein
MTMCSCAMMGTGIRYPAPEAYIRSPERDAIQEQVIRQLTANGWLLVQDADGAAFIQPESAAGGKELNIAISGDSTGTMIRTRIFYYRQGEFQRYASMELSDTPTAAALQEMLNRMKAKIEADYISRYGSLPPAGQIISGVKAPKLKL